MNNIFDLIVTGATIIAALWGLLTFMLKEIRRDIKEMSKDFQRDIREVHGDLSNIRKDIGELRDEQKKSETRIDQLYQICIEMLGTRHKG